MNVVQLRGKAMVSSADLSRWFWNLDRLHALLRASNNVLWGNLVTKEHNQPLYHKLKESGVIEPLQQVTLYALVE